MSTTSPETTTLDVSGYTITRRAWVATDPAHAYALLSDVSRIGLWSPNAVHAQYDENSGPRAGAWFRGRNRRDGAEWESRSQVQKAEPGAEFTYTVLGSQPVPIVRWRWTLTPHGSGTVLSQAWRLLAADPVLGTTYADLDALRDATAESMETTLIALAAWIADDPGA
ncbi:SRPBCC family protein [Actinocorallia populi]|uniref:SRPBCC family protein n=1 Tax=Actinocorallia populi TaxID=2079200 RepID=UPI000D090929|nr:SRPBCC family protein [Actinocorallia populi]